MAPKDPDIEKVNSELHAIHCYGADSKREDPKKKSHSPALSEETFTVTEYRIYRSLIDAPMSISEEEALAAASRRYGVTAAEAKEATNKVQRLLSKNKWYGSPDSEIRQAVDWKGESVN